jgi:hypothetical protein
VPAATDVEAANGVVAGLRRVIDGSVQTSAKLSGFLLGNPERGSEASCEGADESAQTYIDLASSVVGLVPKGGAFTSFLVDQALNAGGDAVSGRFTGNESRVAGEQHSVREVAFTDLQIALAVALAEEGKLPSGALTNESGVTYPWFKGGQFNADSLADPSVRNDFISWMNSGEGGQTLTALLPDVAAEFDHGVNSGSGGAR